MLPQAEGQMPVRLAGDVERVGLGELPVVAVRRARGIVTPPIRTSSRA
jgi:hypothetical protein